MLHNYSKADIAVNEKHRLTRNCLRKYMAVDYIHMTKINNG